MEAPLLRLASAADLPHIASFLYELGGPEFRERLGPVSPIPFYRWKYFHNPDGEAIIGLAVTADRVIGTVAATPRAVQTGKQRCRGFVLGDFFVAPPYRRRGLFSQLLQMVTEEAARRGAELLYAQPNAESVRALQKQSFRLPAQMQEHWHLIPSTTLAHKLGIPAALISGLDEAARSWAVGSRPREVVVHKVERFGPEVDSFWQRVRLRYGWLTVRDAERLNWRYADCPTPYTLLVADRDEMVGLAALACSRESGLATLSDLTTNPHDYSATVALLRAALTATAETGLQRMYAWALQPPMRTKVDEAIRRTCPVARREPVRIAMRLLNQDLRIPDLDWRLGPGDFDGV